MTPRQRLITWGWIAAVIAVSIFPPWESHVRGGGTFPEGYHLLFWDARSQVHVDQFRLAVEWAIITVIATGLHLAWPARRSSAPNTSPDDIKRFENMFFLAEEAPTVFHAQSGKYTATGTTEKDGTTFVIFDVDGPINRRGTIVPLEVWKKMAARGKRTTDS